MSNSRITAQQYVEDGYQALVDKHACNIYWDHFGVDSVILWEGDYIVTYGDYTRCAVASYTRFNVRWHSEEDYLSMQLRYADKALEEAKNMLRLVHDLAQSARNSIAAATTDEEIVLTLTNIDKWAFEQYLKLEKGY